MKYYPAIALALVILTIVAMVIVAFGKTGPSPATAPVSKTVENKGNSAASAGMEGSLNHSFQVIKSPLTGKCFEIIMFRGSEHVFETSCDNYKE